MIAFKLKRTLSAAQGEMLLDVDITLQKGQFATLFGVSGAGKTSILRMLAGLMEPNEGLITVNNEVWLDSSKKFSLPIQKRKVGFVFQDYSLFPNMTVKENLKFALNKRQSSKIIKEIMDIVELWQLENRKPEKLSGGQKQRVALARALVRQPEILLLDEPLSALDETMRSKLQDYLLKVHKEFNLTTILVSHNVAEIFKMSDQVYMLINGKITKEGSPVEVFSDLGREDNFQISGTVLKTEKISTKQSIVHVWAGNQIIKVPSSNNSYQKGENILLIFNNTNTRIEKLKL